MRRHPVLAGLFLTATLTQGFLQGLLVWALREVLVAFSEAGSGLSVVVLLGGAAVILGVWVIRSFGTFAGEILAARLAHKVEIESMLQVLKKLLALSVRFFEKSSQGDLIMASYHDLRGVRQVTIHMGRIVALAVVAWMMSPKLAVIGLVTAPVAVGPVYRLGQRIAKAARRVRLATQTLYDSFCRRPPAFG
jgi:ABC-type multidrug transport system fused ATPase/permease subunit